MGELEPSIKQITGDVSGKFWPGQMRGVMQQTCSSPESEAVLQNALRPSGKDPNLFGIELGRLMF